MWCELVRDGEVDGVGGSYKDHQEQEAQNVMYKTSPFESFLTEWTWGEVCTGDVGIGWAGMGNVLGISTEQGPFHC